MFVGLPTPLANEIPKKNTRKRLSGLMDICDSKYEPIHDEMMLIARNASTWIREYFVKICDIFWKFH